MGESGEFISGRHSYGHIKVLFPGAVTCGNFCSIAGHVLAIMEGHDTERITTYPFTAKRLQRGWYDSRPEHERITRGDIHIGSDVWIGEYAILLSGVTIGHGAVIGACALITKDVPPYTIVGGVPAKKIRQRFPDAIIERLLKLQWWNWPDDLVRERLPLLQSHNYTKFLEIAEG